MKELITMSHGSGGMKMYLFINNIIKKYFSNSVLNAMEDGAILNLNENRIVFTTDSFVITPLFFPGGDIGRLSICGTVNDLTAMGAAPRYLTAGFILEEGLPFEILEKILASMKKTCKEAGVIIAAGDTKVVERGKVDKIFINTSGIGEILNNNSDISSKNAKPGDSIILTGTIGDHEIAVLKERKNLNAEFNIKSDCAPLNGLVEPILKEGLDIHVMRDPTRGGLGAALNEIALSSGVDICIQQKDVPINRIVRSACSIFGFDPFFLANEGKMIIICSANCENRILKLLRRSSYGKNSAVIGKIGGKNKKPCVTLLTETGGEKILFVPEGEQLMRIC